MSALMTPPAGPPAAAPAAVLSIPEAETLACLCDKTLQRLTNDGHKLGRFRVGRAVRYHRATLEAWLKAQADVQAVAPPAAG